MVDDEAERRSRELRERLRATLKRYATDPLDGILGDVWPQHQSHGRSQNPALRPPASVDERNPSHKLKKWNVYAPSQTSLVTKSDDEVAAALRQMRDRGLRRNDAIDALRVTIGFEGTKVDRARQIWAQCEIGVRGRPRKRKPLESN